MSAENGWLVKDRAKRPYTSDEVAFFFWNVFKYTVGFPILAFLTLVTVIWIIFIYIGMIFYILNRVTSVRDSNWGFIKTEWKELIELWKP